MGRGERKEGKERGEYSSFLSILSFLSTTPLPPFGKGDCQLIFEKICIMPKVGRKVWLQ